MSDLYITAKDERARIVAWLRHEQSKWDTHESTVAWLAKAIERGEHWEEMKDEYGYPLNWPKCPGCGLPALDGHITCGQVQCDEAGRR